MAMQGESLAAVPVFSMLDLGQSGGLFTKLLGPCHPPPPPPVGYCQVPVTTLSWPWFGRQSLHLAVTKTFMMGCSLGLNL